MGEIPPLLSYRGEIMFFVNESSGIYTRPSVRELKKYKGIIVGEIHSSDMIEYYRGLIKELKPEYFISEFAKEDVVLSREALEDRLSKATNGRFLKNIPDYQDNYEIYKLAYDMDVKLIGCDLDKNSNYWKSADEEMDDRETFMLNTLVKFQNKRFVCQLGDFHLRSVPIDERFYRIMNISNVDSTGNRNYKMFVHFDSPIWEYFHKIRHIIISREPLAYNTELKYINLTGGG